MDSPTDERRAWARSAAGGNRRDDERMRRGDDGMISTEGADDRGIPDCTGGENNRERGRSRVRMMGERMTTAR